MNHEDTSASRGAIVHEWIDRHGGSEKVVDVMADAFPGIDLVCLWSDVPDRYPEHRVTESWMARTPMRRTKALALPMMPIVWRHLPAGDYDWALVSSHAFAMHARFRRQRSHIRKYVYAHTPARYIWVPELDARGSSRAVRSVAPLFRAVDRRRAREPHAIAANSHYVRERIGHAWDRDSTVIYPPVDVRRIQDGAPWTARLTDDEHRLYDALPEQFVLGASRFIPYKRLDLVIRAGEAAGLPVVLAGHGPQEAILRACAEACSVPVHFVISPSDALLYSLYDRASVFIFPAIEDFGIMPVEAMATGTAVLCGTQGGAIESVLDGETGVHIPDWGDPRLGDAVTRAASLSGERCRSRARDFDIPRFKHQLRTWVGVQDLSP